MRIIEGNWGLVCLANTCNAAVVPMTDLLPASGRTLPLDQTQGFAVTFYTKAPGQRYVLFGPSCNALVETATRDIGAGTTTHTVFVSGNDLPGTVGDLCLSPASGTTTKPFPLDRPVWKSTTTAETATPSKCQPRNAPSCGERRHPVVTAKHRHLAFLRAGICIWREGSGCRVLGG